MAEVTRKRNSTNNTTDDEARVGIQLDADTGKKLDKLASEIGKRAGEALGITIRVTRTDVVRSLIDSKVEELSL